MRPASLPHKMTFTVLILLTIALPLLSGCVKSPSYEETAAEKKRQEQQEAERMAKRKALIELLASKYHIAPQWLNQYKYFRDYWRGQFTSTEIEDYFKGHTVLYEGCVKDIARNSNNSLTLLFQTCRPFPLWNTLTFHLTATPQALKKVMNEHIVRQKKYLAVIEVDRVAGAVDGNEYRKVYQVNGKCLDIEPSPEVEATTNSK